MGWIDGDLVWHVYLHKVAMLVSNYVIIIGFASIVKLHLVSSVGPMCFQRGVLVCATFVPLGLVKSWCMTSCLAFIVRVSLHP